jgi:hypothetical protein
MHTRWQDLRYRARMLLNNPGFTAVAIITLVIAQQIPADSEKATIVQHVGLDDVTITYQRPNVNNRKIWGVLVPYSKVCGGRVRITRLLLSCGALLDMKRKTMRCAWRSNLKLATSLANVLCVKSGNGSGVALR